MKVRWTETNIKVLCLAAILRLYSVQHNGMTLTKTIIRYLATSATPCVTCPYQTAVRHYVWTVISGETSCTRTSTQVIIMEQQQRVEYNHVTDHMVMHCVRLLATLGKFKVQQQHDTRTAFFLRCKPARSLGYCYPRVFVSSYVGRSHCLPRVRKRKNLTLRRLMSYIYGAPILDVSRSHTTTQHSR